MKTKKEIEKRIKMLESLDYDTIYLRFHIFPQNVTGWLQALEWVLEKHDLFEDRFIEFKNPKELEEYLKKLGEEAEEDE